MSILRDGGEEPKQHLIHLYEKARASGLEIPLTFSWVHHAGEPSGERPYCARTAPWYNTELWTGWIGRYGDIGESMSQKKYRGSWKIIAFGGAGYSYYVVHGGTNFR